MYLEEKIIKCIEDSGMRNPAIIVNGAYLTHSGRRVYVTPKQGKLLFFTRVFNKDLKISEDQDIGSQWGYISSQLQSNSLYEVKLSNVQELVDSLVYADAHYDIVFIESFLYASGKKLQQSTNIGAVLEVGSYQTNPAETQAIRNVFLQHSLENYRNLVYASGTNRFIKSLFRMNKLYSIKPISFIPVFINYKNVYNPLDSALLDVKSTAMYQMAVSKGRFVQNGDVSAYFLTHKEICEAFGMSRFARFTPYIWYNLFVGLLQPSNSAFPNKVTKIRKWSNDLKQPEGLKRTYSEEEFLQMLSTNRNLLEEELNQYLLVDSLEDFIEREHSMLKSVGPFYIDEKANLSPGNLYGLYAEAKLNYVKES